MSECNCEIPLYYCTDRPDCKMVARIKSKTPDEISTLRAKLAAAEARAERLAVAFDWIQRQDLDDLRMMLVVEANHDGDFYVCGGRGKAGYGPTLLDAVESAALAEGEAG